MPASTELRMSKTRRQERKEAIDMQHRHRADAEFRSITSEMDHLSRPRSQWQRDLLFAASRTRQDHLKKAISTSAADGKLRHLRQFFVDAAFDRALDEIAKEETPTDDPLVVQVITGPHVPPPLQPEDQGILHAGDPYDEPETPMSVVGARVALGLFLILLGYLIGKF